MRTLKRLISEKPLSKKIDLSICQLEEVDTLIEMLYKFKNLSELNLSYNRLEQLPNDLSILRKLTTLDVTSNLFKNVRTALRACFNFLERGCG